MMAGSIKNSTLAYIFDYGGTLDTGGRHWGKVLWSAWQEVGIPVSETAFREAYVHAERTLACHPVIQPDYSFLQTLSVKLQIALEHAGYPAYHQQLLERMYQQTCEHTAHSREVLTLLAEHYPLALVSNFYGNIHTVLEEFGFAGLFRHVVESAVVGIRKPDSRIFLLGVEALGLQPAEVTVVGDSIDKDILPAREAGCKTIWIRGEQWDDKPIDETLPDQIITDLKELL